MAVTPFTITAVILGASLLLGGTDLPGKPGDVILQALGVVALLALTPSLLARPLDRATRWSLAGLALLLAIPLVQLIPVSEDLWGALPGRNDLAGVGGLVDSAPAFRALTLSPALTLSSFLFLLPVAAVFVGVLLCSHEERRKLCVLVLAFAFLSVLLGAQQAAAGIEGRLSPYAGADYTNRAIGLFGAPAHLAALAYVALPLAVVFAFAPPAQTAAPTPSRDAPRRKSRKRRGLGVEWSFAQYVRPLAGSVLIVVLALGISLTGSRAGVGLAMLAIGAAIALILFQRRGKSRTSILKFVVPVTLIAILVAAFYTVDYLTARFAADNQFRGRNVINPLTWQAIGHFFPVGSGAGTFLPVYKLFETPETLMTGIANRAHNEYFEWLLEAGALAALGLAFAAIWLGAAVRRVWAADWSGQSAQDRLFLRAALLGVCLLLLHASVDYVLRTGATAALMAMFCAMTLRPVRPAATEPAPMEKNSEPG